MKYKYRNFHLFRFASCISATGTAEPILESETLDLARSLRVWLSTNLDAWLLSQPFPAGLSWNLEKCDPCSPQLGNFLDFHVMPINDLGSAVRVFLLHIDLAVCFFH